MKRTANSCNCHKTFQSGTAQKEKAYCSQEFVIPGEKEKEEVVFLGMETPGRKPPATPVE